MKYYHYTNQDTPEALLSLIYHTLPPEKVKIYRLEGHENVCAIDAAEPLLAEWLEAQVVPMQEITLAEYIAKRSESEAWALEWEWIKKQRAQELKASSVAVNAIVYDADETAMDRIDRVLTLANWKYNQAIANGSAPTDAYNAVYKTTLSWKGRDNEFHEIQIESLAKAQEAAINKMKSLWEKYE